MAASLKSPLKREREGRGSALRRQTYIQIAAGAAAKDKKWGQLSLSQLREIGSGGGGKRAFGATTCVYYRQTVRRPLALMAARLSLKYKSLFFSLRIEIKDSLTILHTMCCQ